MQRCSAVRRKGSKDQCTAKPLFGHTLCGRHAKMIKPVLWKDLHKRTSIVKFQALVRGWMVRHYLHLCGRGALNRKLVLNDEDLATFEDKNRQHPYDYFSIEENGKVWWFDFHTIYNWCLQSHQPTNPYSKTPLSTNDRKRIREVWGYRQRHGMLLPVESLVHENRVLGRWNILCQTFEDYGFSDVHPNMFLRMPKASLYTMFRMIGEDIEVSVSKQSYYKEKILNLCARPIRSVHMLPSEKYTLHSLLALMLMLSKPKDPYILVFTILSALHRC